MSEPERSVPQTWRLIEPRTILWTQWGDDYIIYHRPSGKTHFINAATAQLLKNILLEPKTALSAALELAVAQQASCNEEFLVAVGRSLQRLEDVGLVERREG
jgi:PqqD family protein of HPr-rel-A system